MEWSSALRADETATINRLLGHLMPQRLNYQRQAVDVRASGLGSEPLEAVRLRPLMDLTAGANDVVIGLIDGPVALSHPDLAESHFRPIGIRPALCAVDTVACAHGTFVAGILGARRTSMAPSVCPECTILVRPIFTPSTANRAPWSTADELGRAIFDCVDHGATLLNISAALRPGDTEEERFLREALDYSSRRDVLVVVAAGDQRKVGRAELTTHPGVIPVVAFSRTGRPLVDSNLSRSIGLHGVGAPGEAITSLGVDGATVTLSGSSAAVPFVTGAAALLTSLMPSARAAQVAAALRRSVRSRRGRVWPPQIDTWRAYEILRSATHG
jgi:subtilisin family serine protease